MFGRYFAASSALAMSLCLVSGQALAQETPQSEQGEQGDDAKGLGVITVTAQRIGQSLQEVPGAVTAVTNADIERMAINTVTDLGRVTPNVKFDAVTGGTAGLKPYIRGGGVGDGGNITSESEVSIYVDDVYRARLSAAVLDFVELERIEVLRGPQGVLYGRNSSAGAVKIVTKAPSPEFGGFVEAGYGTWNERRLKGYVTTPLSSDGEWAASLNGMIRARDGGRQYNATLDKKVGAENFQGVQGDIAYDGPVVTGRLSVFYTHLDSDGQYAVATNPFANGDAALITPVSGSSRVVLSPFPSYTDVDQYGATLKLTADYGMGTLTSISAYSHLSDNWAEDFSGGVQGTAFGLDSEDYYALYTRESHSKQEQFSQELQAAGALDDDDVLTYVAGVYFFKETGTQNVDNELFFSAYSQGFTVGTSSFAGFGQLTFTPLEGLSLIAGGRYTIDDKDLEASLYGETIRRADTFEKFTPKVAVDWQVTPDILAYGSYSEGFKAGGYNGLAGTLEQLNVPFRPQLTKAKEVGLKSEFFDHALRVNISAFQNDVTDIQQLFNLDDGTFVVDNFNARIRGLEFEARLKVIDALTLWANGALNDGKYTRGGVSAGSTVDVKGKKVVGLPDHQFNLGFDFAAPLVGGDFSFGGDVLIRDDFYATIDNTAIGYVAPQEFVNGYIAYETGPVTFRLTGKNLLQQGGYNTGFGFSVVQPRFAVDPRTFLGTVRFRF